MRRLARRPTRQRNRERQRPAEGGTFPLLPLFHFSTSALHSVPLSITPSLRSAQLFPTAVNAVLAEIRQAQARGQTVVSLMRGEPDFDTPSHIIEAAARAMAAGRTRYPDNRGEIGLREAIAVKLARDNAVSYDPGTEILVTTGATLGIYVALMAVVNDGDEVLLPDPIYDAYRSPITLAGGRPVSVRSSIDQGRFAISAESIESALTSSSRVLLLNTPWNPVGTVLRKQELEAIAAVVLRRGLVLISDEIYEAITYDGATHLSPAALAPEVRAQTIVINSLSKTYAMTGWRLGYCAAPAPITQAMFLALQQASRGPATFIQDAAATALTAPQDAVAQMREEYTRRRTLVLETLCGIPRVRVLPPEGGFFAMVDARDTGLASNDIKTRLLHQAGVAVVHGAAYGPGGEGTLRVSFASGGETLARGLDRLREGLTAL